jgi:anion-transporting  ArsA/GET3 family ATPase
MELTRFCSTSRVVIVAGKGGVGKTTTTAAFALAAARTGMSVLILEVEGKSGLSAAFGRPPLTYHEVELAPGIRARTLTPDQALLDYLHGNGLRRISKRLVNSGALDVVATAVPGMKDILVLGKVKQLDVQRAADLILLDAPAAGHAVSFLLSPRGLLDAVRMGPIRKQAADVIDMLSDPARCQVMLVTIPEETPVNELVDTAFVIEDRVGLSLSPVVVNGCYPHLDVVEDDRHVARDAELSGVSMSEHETRDLARAAEFRAQRQALQASEADRLSELLPLPQVRLPFLFHAELGPPELDVLADAFTEGIEALPVP